MSRLTEETRFERRRIIEAAQAEDWWYELRCVMCDALFAWKRPDPESPKFCPNCGRRNSEAP